MPTVEIVRFPGSDAFVDNPLIMKDCLSILVKSEGCISPYYGVQVEDDRTGYLFVIWETIDHHTKLMNAEVYPELKQSLGLACSGPLDMQHVDFDGDAAAVFASPAMELVTMVPHSGVDLKEFHDLITDLRTNLLAASSCHFVTLGESTENKGTWFLLVGWDSVEAHYEAVGKGAVVEIIKDLHRVSKIELKHSIISKYTKMTDPTTQANYLQIATEHVFLDWILDFDAQIISGSATHHLLVKEDDVKEVVFDTSELDILDTSIGSTSVPVSQGAKVSVLAALIDQLQFDIKEKHKVMGSALHITLPSDLKAGHYIDVTVKYKTTKACTALQWLDKAQTQGKRFPFLFSQCQPIYARAVAPLQDSPSVKITYSARVTSVFPVLLSAVRQSPAPNGPVHDGKEVGKDQVTYTYNQPVPIPSYLLAIASGNVHYRAFPKFEDKEWTSGIWAEPELIDSAYWEFSEHTAKFLAAEENLVTPYKFGVYDLLVLPPSFPYGGMENACLSFLTPTLLTGDRALVDVVVHELTHSWFGNGVTHANASHFWLNEGWTTYIERLLQGILYSPAHRDFSYIIGAKALKNSLSEFEKEPKYQRLVIEFERGEDPDSAYSRVPYDKGANFLLHLERKLGGLEVFLPYVKDYVSTFIGKSITTQHWKEHLYGYWAKHGGPEKTKVLDSIDWNAWLYGQGTRLPVEMDYDTSLAKEVYALAERWDAARSTTDISPLDFKESDLKGFDSNQISELKLRSLILYKYSHRYSIVAFLERLQSYPALPLAILRHLGVLYNFVSTPNAEIRFRFYELVLTDAQSEAAKSFVNDALNWIVGLDSESGLIVGRMKFCRPTFRSAFKVDQDLTVKLWQSRKDAFHPIAKKLIEKDLKLS
ncbi:hypothetical protein H0H92_003027 [Tricholoma furcatifolium]|nr:hypothetical protein H0H92_003027 [Tricholoma furcatifolium]